MLSESSAGTGFLLPARAFVKESHSSGHSSPRGNMPTRFQTDSRPFISYLVLPDVVGTGAIVVSASSAVPGTSEEYPHWMLFSVAVTAFDLSHPSTAHYVTWPLSAPPRQCSRSELGSRSQQCTQKASQTMPTTVHWSAVSLLCPVSFEVHRHTWTACHRRRTDPLSHCYLEYSKISISL